MKHSFRKNGLAATIILLVLPLAIGGLAALLTHGGMEAYQNLRQPALAPPGWIFPVVWSILYVLMGISSALIFRSDDEMRSEALRVYALQLFLNFGWSILFFGFHLYFAAFVWIILLEAVIVIMIAMFFSIRPIAGLLQIPYALWVAFAAYLNFAIFLLNR